MILTEQPKYWLIPDIADNLKLPESQQVQVEIIRPTGIQSKEFTSSVATREFYENDQPFDSNGNPREVKLKRVQVEVKMDAEYILRECVGEIKNLYVSRDNEKDPVPIKNGMELASCRAYGVNDLISAICNEITSEKMTESKKKNLE